MNLQDMLDEYINYKIDAALDVALANKEKTVTKDLEFDLQDFVVITITQFETLDP